MSSDGDAVIGSDAVAVEAVVITLLSIPIFRGHDWQYFWVFQASFALVVLIMLVRVMAGMADTPDISRIRRSIRWSSAFLQLTIIGAISIIAIAVGDYFGVISRPVVFMIISFTVWLSLLAVDVLFLGEFLDSWEQIIEDNAENEFVRKLLLWAFRFGKTQLEGELEGEVPGAREQFKAIALGAFILFAIFGISIPALAILSIFFGGLVDAFFVVLSLFFIRDASRTMYLIYGAASSFEELKWRLRWEFVWFVIRGFLLAGALGYLSELPRHI